MKYFVIKIASAPFVLAATLLAVSMLPPSATAQLLPDLCKVYFAGAPGVPRPVEALMQTRHDRTAEGCLDGGKLHRYASLTAPFSGAFNVCSYIKHGERDFDDHGNDVTSTRFGDDTRTYMAIAGPMCPAQDDSRYIPASTVSEGVFAQLMAFAEKLASSKDAFDAAFDMGSKQFGCGRDKRSKEAQGLGGDVLEREYQTLRTFVTISDPRTRFRVAAITLYPGAYVMQGGYVLRECSGYMLGFSDPRRRADYWHVYVEFTPTGLKVIGYAKLVA